MISVTLRFYGDLNDLLTIATSQGQDQSVAITRQLPAPTSAKDLIEGCGVPHTEVDIILSDGTPVSFSHLIADGERISVYPFFTKLNIPEESRLQPRTLPEVRFLADVNLGKLARYLRLAGFDTAYQNDADDDDLIDQMQEEKRALLTRDRKLLMHKVVKYGYLPRSSNPSVQLEEVLRRFDLFDVAEPFSRCPRCNGSLQEVPKEEVIDQLEPLTKRHFEEFSQCPDCGQVYWAGSHRKRLDARMQRIFNRL
jgi:uncharacterized protein with PIN domain